MAKTAMIHARIDPQLKEEVHRIFKTVGITPSQAISLFFQQVWMLQGLPFDVRIPNAESLAALEEVKHPENLRTYRSTEEWIAARRRATGDAESEVPRQRVAGNDES